MTDTQEIIAMQKEVIPMRECPFCKTNLEPVYSLSGGWVTGHAHRSNGCILGGNFYGRVFSAAWNNREAVTTDNPQLLKYPAHMFASSSNPNKVSQPPPVDRKDLDDKVGELVDAAKEWGDSQNMVDMGTLTQDVLDVYADDVITLRTELAEMVDQIYAR